MAGWTIGALFAAQAMAPATVDLPELERAAAQVRRGGPTPRLAGRRFQLTVVPRERGPRHTVCSGFPSWGLV